MHFEGKIVRITREKDRNENKTGRVETERSNKMYRLSYTSKTVLFIYTVCCTNLIFRILITNIIDIRYEKMFSYLRSIFSVFKNIHDSVCFS